MPKDKDGNWTDELVYHAGEDSWHLKREANDDQVRIPKKEADALLKSGEAVFQSDADAEAHKAGRGKDKK